MKMRYGYYPESLDQDMSYTAPAAVDPQGLYIQVSRAGIMLRTGKDFVVSGGQEHLYGHILCVIRGRGSVFCRGSAFELRTGHACIFAPGEDFHYGSDPHDPMGLVWVEYGGGDSEKITRHIIDCGGSVYDGTTFTDVTDLITAILYQPSQEGPAISLKLYEILMRMCKRAEIQSSSRAGNPDILRYIDDHIGRRLSLEEVARAFGYHPAYFSSLFSKTMGMNFSRYVMNRKICHACYLLETTDLPVEQIAQQLGFCDVSHFIQRFKTIRNITPRAYRNGSVLYQRRHAQGES